MEEDKTLFKDFLNNSNNGSFEKLILKYKNNIIFFISRYVKNLEIAEDIFQDVMLYIIENKEKYNFQYSFKTYLYMIAKSKALDYLKKEKHIESIEDKELVDEKLLEDIILTKERTKKIHNIIKKMPTDYQIVLYLTKIEGLSYKETGKVMEKSESQVKTLMHNAKKKMKQLVVEEKLVKFKDNKIIKLLLLIVVLGILTSGVVYAMYISGVWKKPVEYNYKEEDKNTIMEGNISKEEASECAIAFLSKIGHNNIKINAVEYIRSDYYEEYFWRISTENHLKVLVEAYNGKIKGFFDDNVYEIKETNENKEDVENSLINVYEKLGFSGYELVNIESEDNKEYVGYFYKQYGEIYNKYQGIKIKIIPTLEKVVTITIFDEEYQDTNIVITKEEAINIAKTKVEIDKIENIEAYLSIEKMNAFVYAQDNPISKDGVKYKTDNLIRKVWRVEIDLKNNLYDDVRSFFIDVETGEIIGGDATR